MMTQLEITTRLCRATLPDLSSNDKHTLIAISSFVNPQRDKDARAWPTNQRLASITNLSERSIKYSLARLEELQYLERVTKFHQDSNSRSRILILNLDKLAPPKEQPDPVPVQDVYTEEEWAWGSDDDDQDNW